jgi:hypothetical protein
LAAAREACGGDIDKFLILLTVAIRAAGHHKFAEAARTTRRTGGTREAFPTLGLKIQSVADSIGAPKETVRRKVAELAEAGWIERREHQLHLTPQAYKALTPVRERMHAQVARDYQTVLAMLQAAAADAPEDRRPKVGRPDTHPRSDLG